MKTANRRQTHRLFQNRKPRSLVARLSSTEGTGAMAKDNYDKTIAQ